MLSKVNSIEKPKYYLIQRSKVLHEKLQFFSCSRNFSRFGRLEVLLPSSKEPPLNKTILNDLIQIKIRFQYFFFVIKSTSCTNFTNLFHHETLHVSDISFVHHQELIRCTLSNGICHTGL
jgi:hypothetical protein